MGQILLHTKTFLTTGRPRPLFLAILIGIIALLLGSDSASLDILPPHVLVGITTLAVVVFLYWILDND